jgi:hypothetical protein
MPGVVGEGETLSQPQGQGPAALAKLDVLAKPLLVGTLVRWYSEARSSSPRLVAGGVAVKRACCEVAIGLSFSSDVVQASSEIVGLK